jgi:hypothetical protein
MDVKFDLHVKCQAATGGGKPTGFPDILAALLIVWLFTLK